MLENDELVFLGAAILLAQMPNVDDTNIRTAVANAHKLRGEVKKQLDEIRANEPYGVLEHEKEQKAKGQS